MSSASLAVGWYCPVSMELIVFLETPIKLASSACDICCCFLISATLLCRTNDSFILDHLSQS